MIVDKLLSVLIRLSSLEFRSQVALKTVSQPSVAKARALDKLLVSKNALVNNEENKFRKVTEKRDNILLFEPLRRTCQYG